MSNSPVRTVVWLDHDKQAVQQVANDVGAAKRNQKDRRLVSEAFRFENVIVKPGDRLVQRARDAIVARCGERPDLVLVDLAFEDEHQTESSVEVGRGLALDLMEQLATKVGVYTRQPLSPLRRAQLTSDGLSLVLEQITFASEGPNRLTGDQWSDLFNKMIGESGNTKNEAPAEGGDGAQSSARAETSSESAGKILAIAEPSQPGEVLRPDQILTAMHPKDWHGLYVVGSFDKRITFYSQQARALTLVRALFEDRDLRKGERVAVIGGGAAGITAAMACASKGCETHLYERRDSVLYVQKESQHRYLHPHIYDWPQVGSTESDAQLPLLNWSAGYAHEIAANLRSNVEKFVAASDGLLSVHTNSKITKCEKTGETQSRIRIVGNEGSNEGKINEGFHVAIIANGYGPDDKRPSTPSYWSPDEITASHDKEKRHILISGSGDGGLVDLARASLDGFRHDAILNELAGLEELGHEMERIDDIARRARRHNGSVPNLRKDYDQLEIPQDIIDKIKSQRRTDNEVTFNFRDPSIYSLDCALINRLLAVLLLKAEVVKQKHAEIKEDSIKQLDGGRYRVTFNGADDTGEFDLVILRHGPKRDYFEKRWPDIAPDCKELAGKLAELGLTGTLSSCTREWYANNK